MDLIASFEKFLKEKDPDVCLTCWGVGKLHRKGWFVNNIEIECPTCKGTGNLTPTDRKEQGDGKT